MFGFVEKDINCKYCQGESSTEMWDFLDQVYCICLKERDDRYTKSLEETHYSGLCSKIRYFRPPRSKDGFVAGCWTSHVEVCQEAIKNEKKQVTLVLEDDFQFDKSLPIDKIALEIKTAITKLPNVWKRLSLGHYAWFSIPYAAGVHRSSAVLTHAQIWSEKGLQWMIDNPVEKKPDGILQLDGYISLNLPHSYALSPMRIFQKPLGSENSLTNMEKAVSQPYLEAGSIYIPICWTIGLLLLFIILSWIFFKLAKWGIWKSLGIAFVIVFIPFIVIWILILCNVF
jgi:hypothetical protein